MEDNIIIGELDINRLINDDEKESIKDFLINLKYATNESREVYENILLSYKKEMNLTDATLDKIEEKFVTNISNAMISTEDFPKDINAFIELLMTHMENMGLIVDVDIISNSNPVDILNTTIESLLPIDFKESNNLFNNSVTMFEAEFREWIKEKIKDNKLEINCN